MITILAHRIDMVNCSFNSPLHDLYYIFNKYIHKTEIKDEYTDVATQEGKKFCR
jgi:hypothetical protein